MLTRVDTKWICLLVGAIPVAFWVVASTVGTLGLSRAIRPRPHRARALAARLVRELGGHSDEGRLEAAERGQWRARVRRHALDVAACVSSTGFGDVVMLEVRGPRSWVPEGVRVQLPKHGRSGIPLAPPNLAREGVDRRWHVAPADAPIEPPVLDWLFSPASLGVLEIRDQLVSAVYRRDDANDDAHVADIRTLIDALGAIARR